MGRYLYLALRWLADQNAAFVMLERDGSVLATTGPVRPSDARLRRAQALAMQSGSAIHIAKELIDRKIAGQERVARHKLLSFSNRRHDFRVSCGVGKGRLSRAYPAG